MPHDLEAAWTELETRLGYPFRQRDLLRQALTHRSHLAHSASNGSHGPNGSNGSNGETACPPALGHYERLEFFGDAVLNLLISRHLFHQFPMAPEGLLSQWRAKLVSTRSLAGIGRALHLGGCLRLGRGEEMSGGRAKESILADVVEALLGAIYLDAGEAAVHHVVERLFGQELAAIDPGQSGKDYKTVLQEQLQATGLPLPVYRVVSVEGAAHDRTFTVVCQAAGLPDGSGVGRSKRVAEQEAARMVLDHYQNTVDNTASP